MVYRKISDDIKYRAVDLITRGDLERDFIADVLGVSERSLYRWMNHLGEHGDVKPPKNPLQGRPRTFTNLQLYEILAMVDGSPDAFLDEIQEYIAIQHDLCLSKSQLHQLIRDCGITYKLLRRAAVERDPIVRQHFMDFAGNNLYADMIVALDESSKDDQTIYRHYGRSSSGSRAQIPVNFVRGDRWSIVAALTVSDGYIACRVVPGSVDTVEFNNFVLNDVVSCVSVSHIARIYQPHRNDKQLPLMNPFPGRNSVLLLDNCSIHKSEVLRECLEESGILLLFLPPYSPDFNPIEMSFASGKGILDKVTFF